MGFTLATFKFIYWHTFNLILELLAKNWKQIIRGQVQDCKALSDKLQFVARYQLERGFAEMQLFDKLKFVGLWGPALQVQSWFVMITPTQFSSDQASMICLNDLLGQVLR